MFSIGLQLEYKSNNSLERKHIVAVFLWNLSVFENILLFLSAAKNLRKHKVLNMVSYNSGNFSRAKSGLSIHYRWSTGALNLRTSFRNDDVFLQKNEGR